MWMPQIVLDDPRSGGERIYARPLEVVRADAIGQVDAAFAKLEDALAAGRHAAGYFSYELGYALERRLVPLMPSSRNVPLLWFGIFADCEFGAGCADESAPRIHAGRLAHEWDEARHAAAFERIHALIAAGDLYQANLSYRARFAFVGEPYAFYRELRSRAHARHCAFVDDGERQIASISPELFFDISSAGVVRTRPMKGTAARGTTTEEDNAARARLAASEKERAENLMIVDLVRNDLSRIAIPGSVEVENLFEVETYPTVHQLVSTVAARLAPGIGVETIVRALFPCGSVTGAPKFRAMEVIREIETSPRGVYCGAIGYFAPDGSAAFNVAIRTLTISGGNGELGIGGAIVFDSRARTEYEECRVKARFYEAARHPLQLIETLRYEPGTGFLRLGRHLARITSSAAALGFAFDAACAGRELQRCVAGRLETLRVRLTLHEDGMMCAEAEPFVASRVPWRFAVSPVRVSGGDPLLRHKTSRRELHDSEHARLAASLGCDEVLFLNERGELTEGSRTNIFLEIEGRLLTPPIACGLLDGCLRRELVEQGRCLEAALTGADLDRASKIFLGNSLRGLVPGIEKE
jgi:para-aminobenzoate synthetase / 4-amino-4-deoxychorismate lyase